MVQHGHGVATLGHQRRSGPVSFRSRLLIAFALATIIPLVMLAYGGEDHGLRRRANQIDYHRRILQWFGKAIQLYFGADQ